MKRTGKKLWALLLTATMTLSMAASTTLVGAAALDVQDEIQEEIPNDVVEDAVQEGSVASEDEADPQDAENGALLVNEEARLASGSGDYVYGTVNMDYADFYYGELEGIVPSDRTEIPVNAQDPVTSAGYRETGYYDAATFATPRGFIYEKKWETWPGTYVQPIVDEYGITVGGQILGVADVNVAVLKSVYEAAKADPTSVVGEKVSKITLNADQSAVPISYKVLNSDGVYTRFVNPTAPVEPVLDGALHTEYMGDDIWWEGKAMKHDNATQTIIGGLIEWTADPSDPNSERHVTGLKHDENMYSDTWIGWGMGPGNVGIYGGNETGWQRFDGISGKYLTKMSYILLNEDGSVTYYNASSAEGLLNPYLPNGIKKEDGSHYGVELSHYEFTKERVLIDFALDVPTRADGTPEVDYYLTSCSAPGVSLSCSGENATYRTHPEIMPVYEESAWVNGHKTIHMEVSRAYMGTGRFKYWFYPNEENKQETDRTFGRIASWKMLYPDLTSENVYLRDGKICVDSDIFTVQDYMDNPYQQIEIIGNRGTEKIWSTGDAYSNRQLFAGAVKADGTVVDGMIKEDGTIDVNAMYYYTTRERDENGNRVTIEHLDPIFPNGADEEYEVILYSGGFPIVKGTLDHLTTQEITVAATSYSKKYGDGAFSLGASALTDLSYQSDNEGVATVNTNGEVTIVGAGTAAITITAARSDTYREAVKTVNIKVAKAAQTITGGKASYSKKYGDKAFVLGVKAKTALTYASDKKTVAVVDKTGKVTIKGAGTAKLTITAAGNKNYDKATKTVTVRVAKAAPTIKVKKSSAAYTAAKVKVRSQSFSLGASVNSKGRLAFAKRSGSAKVTIDKKGKVTVKKGTAKGTYKVRVDIKAAAKGSYNAGKKTVTITVKVK